MKKVMFGVVGNSNGVDTARPLTMDTATRAMAEIEFAHHMIHRGLAFYLGIAASLAGGDVMGVALTTPSNGKYCHTQWDFRGSAGGTISILESVTSFSGGAAATPVNMNRPSTLTSDCTALTGRTGSNLITPTGGTDIWPEVFGSGVNAEISRVSGFELILKPGTKYLFQITNGVGANNAAILVSWYELTPLN